MEVLEYLPAEEEQLGHVLQSLGILHVHLFEVAECLVHFYFQRLELVGQKLSQRRLVKLELLFFLERPQTLHFLRRQSLDDFQGLVQIVQLLEPVVAYHVEGELGLGEVEAHREGDHDDLESAGVFRREELQDVLQFRQVLLVQFWSLDPLDHNLLEFQVSLALLYPGGLLLLVAYVLVRPFILLLSDLNFLLFLHLVLLLLVQHPLPVLFLVLLVLGGLLEPPESSDGRVISVLVVLVTIVSVVFLPLAKLFVVTFEEVHVVLAGVEVVERVKRFLFLLLSLQLLPLLLLLCLDSQSPLQRRHLIHILHAQLLHLLFHAVQGGVVRPAQFLLLLGSDAFDPVRNVEDDLDVAVRLTLLLDQTFCPSMHFVQFFQFL